LVSPALALLIACVGPTPSLAPSGTSPAPTEEVSQADLQSYVFGTVSAGPVCPVERVPPDPSCAPRAVSGAVITATFPGQGEAARATSGADGDYRLVIAGYGTVILTASPVSGLLGTPAAIQVSLEPAESRQVNFLYDTGIR
jgi:hypothetical protein